MQIVESDPCKCKKAGTRASEKKGFPILEQENR